MDCSTAPILLFEFVAAIFRVEPANARHAAIRRAHPFENFDGGRLARAVRPEQAEDFAFFDGKADAAQRFHRAVTFVEVLRLG